MQQFSHLWKIFTLLQHCSTPMSLISKLSMLSLIIIVVVLSYWSYQLFILFNYKWILIKNIHTTMQSPWWSSWRKRISLLFLFHISSIIISFSRFIKKWYGKLRIILLFELVYILGLDWYCVSFNIIVYCFKCMDIIPDIYTCI